MYIIMYYCKKPAIEHKRVIKKQKFNIIIHWRTLTSLLYIYHNTAIGVVHLADINSGRSNTTTDINLQCVIIFYGRILSYPFPYYNYIIRNFQMLSLISM